MLGMCAIINAIWSLPNQMDPIMTLKYNRNLVVLYYDMRLISMLIGFVMGKVTIHKRELTDSGHN
jgi:hypothetical protein